MKNNPRIGQIWECNDGSQFVIDSIADNNLYWCKDIATGKFWGMGFNWFNGIDYKLIK